ncbi:MAG: sulfur carrier protein ThiS [Wigglesworthia glossinidia]|nr:sulfur carrier protein ThiS [Wigglesworthia glossinidia]
MKIIFNDSQIEISNKITLLEFISKYHKETFGLAVSVNNTVIPKKEWFKLKIKKNDNIILFQAIAGG